MDSLINLIKEIKLKKEFADLPDSLIENMLVQYLEKHSILIENLSAKQSKIIVKDVRSKLRLLTGRFKKTLKNRGEFLEQDSIEELLKTHTSTSERISFYPKLKKIINSLNVNSILDLGCGLNPIALASPEIRYYASDIKKEELEIIERYFKKNKIKGRAFVYDLINSEEVLPEADLCLLFKVIDVIDPASKKRGRLTENLLLRIPCQKILASFATKKISGQPMKHPKREWFERLLKRLKFDFDILYADNEIFYLIDPNPSYSK